VSQREGFFVKLYQLKHLIGISPYIGRSGDGVLYVDPSAYFE